MNVLAEYIKSIKNGIFEAIMSKYSMKTILLLNAIKTSKLSVWNFLGLDINEFVQNSKTVVMLAAKKNNKYIIDRIINEYAELDLNIQNERGNTALHYAAKYVN